MESTGIYLPSQHAPATHLREAWGDIVDMSEYWKDTPDFFPSFGGLPYSTLDDRLDGKYQPYYRTEQDLAFIRGRSRNLAAIDGVAIGASESLKNYVLGNGMLFKAQARKKQSPPQGLVEFVQAMVDVLLDKWCFYGSLDRELMDRTIEDGEAGVCLEWTDNQPRVSVVEPDQITQPRTPVDLYDWLSSAHQIDCDSFEPSWSFGILTSKRHTDQPLGYHVVYDTGGIDWDFYPVHQFEHFKSVRTRKAKRGVSQYFPVIEDMRAEAKLSTNMALGGALQSAIAWIEQNPTGAKQSDVQSMNGAKADIRSSRPTVGNGTRNVNQRQYRPGTILNISPGREYKPGPMGAERNAGFQLVAQYILRRIGIRWNFPEYMISGDASNANYSSTLVAGSPFVKAREAEQVFYGASFRSLILKALRMCHEHGCFDKFGLEWATILQLVDIVPDPTKVETRDPLQLAQTQEIQKRMGILSDRTAATQAGLDYDQEVESGAKAEQPAPSPFGQPGIQESWLRECGGEGSGIPGPCPEGIKKHDVKLPVDKKRLSIDQAHEALRQMGFSDIKPIQPTAASGWKAATQVKTPDGKLITLDSKQIVNLVYSEFDQEGSALTKFPQTRESRLQQASALLWEGYP